MRDVSAVDGSVSRSPVPLARCILHLCCMLEKLHCCCFFTGQTPDFQADVGEEQMSGRGVEGRDLFQWRQAVSITNLYTYFHYFQHKHLASWAFSFLFSVLVSLPLSI